MIKSNTKYTQEILLYSTQEEMHKRDTMTQYKVIKNNKKDSLIKIMTPRLTGEVIPKIKP